jgi:polyribonucleotide nucleotidyltransferase
MGGKDGLVHVSEMRNERVEKPTDVVKEGQGSRFWKSTSVARCLCR